KHEANTMRLNNKEWLLLWTAPVLMTIFLLAADEGAAQAGPEEKPATGTIDNFSFGPQTLTVPAGTRGTGTKHDDVPHTVVSNDQVFKSKVLDTDETFSFTFSKAGTYPYFCSVHPKMTAKIVVK